MTYRISPKALDDIAFITAYIRRDNPPAAERWFANLERRFEALDAMPGMGRARPEFGDGVRVSVVGVYLILYRQHAEVVDIIRIVHGMRDPANWLDG